MHADLINKKNTLSTSYLTTAKSQTQKHPLTQTKPFQDSIQKGFSIIDFENSRVFAQTHDPKSIQTVKKIHIFLISISFPF